MTDGREESVFDQLARLMRGHDWYYQYSDDYGVWKRGQNQRDVIRNVLSKAREIDPNKASKVWNDNAPDDFKRKT